MKDYESFTLSDAEVQRMRRGAFLPILLVIPLALMFGMDASKSQPMHFLMTLLVATIIAAIIVSISWNGAKRRIADFAKTTLTVSGNKLIWDSTFGKSELSLDAVTGIAVRETRGSVRSITLIRADGNRTRLEGYGRMDVLLDKLQQNTKAEIKRTMVWLNV